MRNSLKFETLFFSGAFFAALSFGDVLVGEELQEAEDVELSAVEEECATIINKNATGQPLSPSEGDKLIVCFYPPDLANPGTGPGFQAYQPPPSLYELENFNQFPGVLGGGMVNG